MNTALSCQPRPVQLALPVKFQQPVHYSEDGTREKSKVSGKLVLRTFHLGTLHHVLLSLVCRRRLSVRVASRKYPSFRQA